MTEVPLPYLERVKLTSELLIGFKRVLPFYRKNRPDYEIQKMEVEIKYHKRMLREARKELRAAEAAYRKEIKRCTTHKLGE